MSPYLAVFLGLSWGERGWGLPRLREQGGLPRGGNAELSPESLGRFCWGRRQEMLFQKEEQTDKVLEAWKPVAP